MTTSSGQHRLCRLQVVNWGTINRYIDLPVPRSGLLVTGESGSGKSSLLDAMAALLVRPSKLTLNAAAQDGGVGDRSRSLLTYVRGAHKREADAESGEIATAYMRPGAAWSGICLAYDDGRGRITSLVRLLHVAASGVAAKDVKSLYVLAEESVDLLALATYADKGLDMRRLKADQPNWLITGEYSAFAARMQSRFGLESEQAQLLLHKTQSAKNLTSLDVLLREFMLDPPQTFDLADQAVEQFEQLSAAHHTVVDARQQVEALSKLDSLSGRRAELLNRTQELDDEIDHLEAFRLIRMAAEANAKAEQLTSRVAGLEAEVRRAEDTLALRQTEQRSAARVVDGLGGAELALLQQQQADAARRVEQAGIKRAQYAQQAQIVGLALPDQRDDMPGFARAVTAKLAQTEETEADRAGRYELADQAAQAIRAREGVEQKLRTLETQRSPQDERLLAVRRQLADIAQCDPSRLSFAGELISVRPTEVAWTGAIERVLRPLAQTLLVPNDLYPLVSDFVDRTHLGTRLTYLRVPKDSSPIEALNDNLSLISKIEVISGEFSSFLNRQLSRRFDYACVESAAQLRGVDRGVTRQGQVKHSSVRHEKDDRWRIDDPSHWLLGSSIDSRRRALRERLRECQDAEATAKLVRDEREAANKTRQDAQLALNLLHQVEWEMIDEAGPLTETNRLAAQIAQLRGGNQDLAQAQAQLDRAQLAVTEADDAAKRLRDQRSRTQVELDSATAQRDQAQATLLELPAVPEAVTARLTCRFAEQEGASLEKASRQVRSQLEGESRESGERLKRVENNCVNAMSNYKSNWPVLAADLAADVGFINDYVQILASLRADRLPEFEQRFFDLLQSQSRNNIGVLARQISSSRREIRQRIEPINRSLLQSEYAPGRYLKLIVKDDPPADVQEFVRTLNTIASGSLDDTIGADPSPEERELAEERFSSLENLLHRLSSTDPADRTWRNHCLDTRLHVRFQADVLDGVTGQAIDHYLGAGGLSGGERQKLVVFCLAAALRYQLARDGSGSPTYGLVVLDEAFDKTDPAFTQAGLDVFRDFGFQLLVATPLKMLQTLQAYVGGAVLIRNREGEGSRCEKLIWDDTSGTDQAAIAPLVEQDALL